MKFFAAVALLLIVAVAVNAEFDHIRAKRSVTTFGSHGSTVTDTGNVLTHGTNHVTTANHGNVGHVANVHNSNVGRHGATHNNVHNVAHTGPAGTHHTVSSVHTVNTHH